MCLQRTTPDGTVFNHELESVHFEYEPGFKAGAGYQFGGDNWDLFLNYTWLRAQQSRTINAHSGEALVPIMMQGPGNMNISSSGNNFPSCQQAKASVNFRFNVLELKLARNRYLSRNVTWRPFAGLKRGLDEV